MDTAKVWIESNPTTGSQRPWELYFQVEGKQVRHVSSSATEAGALKSMKALIKRCDGMYLIEVVEAGR